MKHRFIIFFSALIFFVSCKSLRNLASKNNSSSSQFTAQNKERKIQFISGIEAKQGDVYRIRTSNEKIVYAPPPFIVPNVNIEKLSVLQVRYAIILDATVEELTNVSLLENIDHWWGTPYCYGGNSENCIDCSAFTQYLMHTVFKISVPRTAQEQYDNSVRIEAESLKEGDLVFFHTSGATISHVGIYLINDKFVHASSSSGVMVSDLNDDYWKQRYVGAGRVR